MFPIRDSVRSGSFPIMTVSIIALNTIIFLLEWHMPTQELQKISLLYGIVPMRFTHPGWAREIGFPSNGYWPFLTTLFLHGGWLHIIGNMWSLWIFGDNVEERMGPIRFLVFYLLCGIMAGVLHTVTNPMSQVPVIGASGAIAGVLGAYLFMFPKSWILCLFPIFFLPLFIEIPAVVFIVVWILIQFYSGSVSLTGHATANIAWWAHVGGFAFGLLFFRQFLAPKYRRKRQVEAAPL